MVLRWRRVPDWSAFDDRSTHRAFVEAVQAQLDVADLGATTSDDGRTVSLGDGATLDLAALTAAAVDVPADGWPDLVDGAVASATNPNRPSRDPDRLRELVRVRLLPAAEHARFPKPLPHRPHADLAEVLVVQGARGLVWADEDDLAPLALELDELFAVGRANVRAHEPVRRSALDVGGAVATLVTGDHDYVASWLLHLEELVDPGDAGVAVAVPTRRTLLALPVDDDEDTEVRDALAAEAAARAAAGPGRLSPTVLRWRDGALTVPG